MRNLVVLEDVVHAWPSLVAPPSAAEEVDGPSPGETVADVSVNAMTEMLFVLTTLGRIFGIDAEAGTGSDEDGGGCWRHSIAAEAADIDCNNATGNGNGSDIQEPGHEPGAESEPGSKQHSWFACHALSELSHLVCLSHEGRIHVVDTSNVPGTAPSFDVGFIDAGLLAGRWAPDDGMLCLITGNNSVLCMSNTWDVVCERPLEPPIHLGQVLPTDAGQVHLAWRPDSQAVALSAVTASTTDESFAPSAIVAPTRTTATTSPSQPAPAPGARSIRFLQRTDDMGTEAWGRNENGGEVKKLGSVLAWSKNGSLLAGVQGVGKKKAQVVFFEPNGQRHREFALQEFQPATDCLRCLDWNLESNLLLVAFSRTTAATTSPSNSSTTSTVQIYHRNNYHWYLKWHTTYPAGVSVARFDAERPYRCYIALGVDDDAGDVELHLHTLDFCWDVHVGPDPGCSACVVDGSTLLVTPLMYRMVPPPLADQCIAMHGPVRAVAHTPRLVHTAAGVDSTDVPAGATATPSRPRPPVTHLTAVCLADATVAILATRSRQGRSKTNDPHAAAAENKTSSESQTAEEDGVPTGTDSAAVEAGADGSSFVVGHCQPLHTLLGYPVATEDPPDSRMTRELQEQAARVKQVTLTAAECVGDADRVVAALCIVQSAEAELDRVGVSAASAADVLTVFTLDVHVSAVMVTVCGWTELALPGRCLRLAPWGQLSYSHDLLLHLHSGEVSRLGVTVPPLDRSGVLADGNGQSPVCELEPEHVRLLEPCPWVSVVHLPLADGSTRDAVVGLSSRYRLYFEEQLLCNSASTLWVNPAFSMLMFVTFATQPQLCFVPLALLALWDPLHGADSEVSEFIMAYEPRSVERGARLVCSCQDTPEVVLQMPRGNLEAFSPRALVLIAVRRLIDQRRYRQAFLLCRRQRVDLNLLVDHDPAQWFSNIPTFLRQVAKPEWLNLFISSLHDDNVTQWKYPLPAWYRIVAAGHDGGVFAPQRTTSDAASTDTAAGVSSADALDLERTMASNNVLNTSSAAPAATAALTPSFASAQQHPTTTDATLSTPSGTAEALLSRLVTEKVNTVCESLRERMLPSLQHGDAWIEPILTTFAKQSPARLEDALALIRDQSSSAVASAGAIADPSVLVTGKVQSRLKYLGFLAEPDAVYDAALGMYDYDLVRATARLTQKDPKVYGPLLKRLRGLPVMLARYEVDKMLNRHESAARHLFQAGPEHMEACIQLILERSLFSVGLELFHPAASASASARGAGAYEGAPPHDASALMPLRRRVIAAMTRMTIDSGDLMRAQRLAMAAQPALLSLALEAACCHDDWQAALALAPRVAYSEPDEASALLHTGFLSTSPIVQEWISERTPEQEIAEDGGEVFSRLIALWLVERLRAHAQTRAECGGSSEEDARAARAAYSDSATILLSHCNDPAAGVECTILAGKWQEALCIALRVDKEATAQHGKLSGGADDHMAAPAALSSPLALHVQRAAVACAQRLIATLPKRCERLEAVVGELTGLADERAARMRTEGTLTDTGDLVDVAEAASEFSSASQNTAASRYTADSATSSASTATATSVMSHYTTGVVSTRALTAPTGAEGFRMMREGKRDRKPRKGKRKEGRRRDRGIAREDELCREIRGSLLLSPAQLDEVGALLHCLLLIKDNDVDGGGDVASARTSASAAVLIPALERAVEAALEVMVHRVQLPVCPPVPEVVARRLQPEPNLQLPTLADLHTMAQRTDWKTGVVGSLLL